MELGLTNKVVLVTGSNRGTGFVIAQRFADEGATVIMHALDPDADFPAVPGVSVVRGDITNPVAAAAVCREALACHGRMDVLVNNYGVSSAASWASGTTQDWQHIYAANTLSVMYMAQGLMPALAASAAARIINLGTTGVDRPGSRNPHYYASKAALANMTLSLAKEAGTNGITVNLVSPGLIRTPEVEAAYLKRAIEAGWGDTWAEAEPHIVKQFAPNPLGRVATRDEVADTVLFLASERAGFLTGQNIRVDGGGSGVA